MRRIENNESMMYKKTPLYLIWFLFFLLASCSQSLPSQMPDSINSDELDLNTYIGLSAPKECNTYKPGKEVCLEVKNLSDREWDFSITSDILIYRYEDKKWKLVADEMENIGATELTLSPKGTFPLDTDLIAVLPDIEPDASINLRIILIVHQKNLGFDKATQRKGAYIDLTLRP